MSFLVVFWEEAKSQTHVCSTLTDAIQFAWKKIETDKSPVTVDDIDGDRTWNEAEIRREILGSKPQRDE